LVKLKIKTITKGIKKNKVTTTRVGERKAYGNNQLFDLGKLERELVPLSSCKLLLI